MTQKVQRQADSFVDRSNLMARFRETGLWKSNWTPSIAPFRGCTRRHIVGPRAGLLRPTLVSLLPFRAVLCLPSNSRDVVCCFCFCSEDCKNDTANSICPRHSRQIANVVLKARCDAVSRIKGLLDSIDYYGFALRVILIVTVGL